MNNLYVFIDVSGNYDFSLKGTKYVVLTSLICSDVSPGILEVYKLRHSIIEQGVNIEYFHASEDRQIVRDQVFNIINGLTNIRIDSLIIEKCMTAPSLRPLNRFYPRMVEYLLKYPFNPKGIDIDKYEKVFIFIDRESSRASDRDALIKALKISLAGLLRSVPYTICMHSSASHPYLQIVDYCSWAIYVKHEKSEIRPYKKIYKLIKSEFSIFTSGVKKWY
jgi:hypothetical protein